MSSEGDLATSTGIIRSLLPSTTVEEGQKHSFKKRFNTYGKYLTVTVRNFFKHFLRIITSFLSIFKEKIFTKTYTKNNSWQKTVFQSISTIALKNSNENSSTQAETPLHLKSFPSVLIPYKKNNVTIYLHKYGISTNNTINSLGARIQETVQAWIAQDPDRELGNSNNTKEYRVILAGHSQGGLSCMQAANNILSSEKTRFTSLNNIKMDNIKIDLVTIFSPIGGAKELGIVPYDKNSNTHVNFHPMGEFAKLEPDIRIDTYTQFVAGGDHLVPKTAEELENLNRPPGGESKQENTDNVVVLEDAHHNSVYNEAHIISHIAKKIADLIKAGQYNNETKILVLFQHGAGGFPLSLVSLIQATINQIKK